MRHNIDAVNSAKESYTGKEQDAESNLHYFGARYYDAAIGRWLSMDPETFPSWSSYNYVFNNPVIKIDRFGRSGKDVTKAAVHIDNKYYYYYSGKNPFNSGAEIWNPDFIYAMSKSNYYFWKKYKTIPYPFDLGFDCSGFVGYLNEQNPDHSSDLSGKNARMMLEHFEENSDNFTKIANWDDLQKGDFLAFTDGSHIGILVKDTKSGELRIAEAATSGEKAGIKGVNRLNRYRSKMKKNEMVGFHDKGNDRGNERKKMLPKNSIAISDKTSVMMRYDVTNSQGN